MTVSKTTVHTLVNCLSFIQTQFPCTSLLPSFFVGVGGGGRGRVTAEHTKGIVIKCTLSVLFLQTGAHSPLQSKETKHSQSKSALVHARTQSIGQLEEVRFQK